VGVGVLIKNDKGEVLLGKRKGSHGAGEWGFPGGSLRFGEKVIEAVIRETKEETGLDIYDCELISVFDELGYMESDKKHYLGIGMSAKYKGGEPKIMEPEKCEEWRWFSLDNLPENVFEGSALVIKSYKAGKIYQQ